MLACQCKLSFLLTGTLVVKNVLPGARILGFKSWLCYFLVNALGKLFSLFCLNFLIYKMNVTIMFVELQYGLSDLVYFKAFRILPGMDFTICLHRDVLIGSIYSRY